MYATSPSQLLSIAMLSAPQNVAPKGGGEYCPKKYQGRGLQANNAAENPRLQGYSEEFFDFKLSNSFVRKGHYTCFLVIGQVTHLLTSLSLGKFWGEGVLGTKCLSAYPRLLPEMRYMSNVQYIVTQLYFSSCWKPHNRERASPLRQIFSMTALVNRKPSF